MCATKILTGFAGGTRPICGPCLLDDALHRLVVPDHSWAPSRSAILIRISALHI